MGKIKFIRIADKFINMDEVESIEHTSHKIPINFSFDTKDEYCIKITYKSGRVDIMPLKNEKAGNILMENINASIKRWNVENGE